MASGTSVRADAELDAGGLGVVHEAEAAGQAQLGREHGALRHQRDLVAAHRRVAGEGDRRLAAADDGDALADRPLVVPLEPAAQVVEARPGGTGGPHDHVRSRGCDSRGVGRAFEVDRDAGVGGRADEPVEQAAEVGVGLLGQREPAAEAIAGLPELDRVAPLGQPAGALEAGRVRRPPPRRGGPVRGAATAPTPGRPPG